MKLIEEGIIKDIYVKLISSKFNIDSNKITNEIKNIPTGMLSLNKNTIAKLDSKDTMKELIKIKSDLDKHIPSSRRIFIASLLYSLGLVLFLIGGLGIVIDLNSIIDAASILLTGEYQLSVLPILKVVEMLIGGLSMLISKRLTRT